MPTPLRLPRGRGLLEPRTHLQVDATHRPPAEATIELTSKQRAFLRAKAHSLRPRLQIGSEGVSEALLRSLEEVLSTRELLKVKVLENSPQAPREVAALLPGRVSDLHVAQVIGRTLVLYRPNPEARSIVLPP